MVLVGEATVILVNVGIELASRRNLLKHCTIRADQAIQKLGNCIGAKLP